MFDSSLLKGLSTEVTLGFTVILLVVVIFSLYSLMRLFDKVGVSKIAAWIPGYNIWVLFEIAGMKGYWSLLIPLAFVPYVGILASIILIIVGLVAANNIGQGFRKDKSWVMMYFFVPLIWLYRLSFDGSTWEGLEGSGALFIKEGEYEPLVTRMIREHELEQMREKSTKHEGVKNEEVTDAVIINKSIEEDIKLKPLRTVPQNSNLDVREPNFIPNATTPVNNNPFFKKQ